MPDLRASTSEVMERFDIQPLPVILKVSCVAVLCQLLAHPGNHMAAHLCLVIYGSIPAPSNSPITQISAQLSHYMCTAFQHASAAEALKWKSSCWEDCQW